jgi:hypothetical protein
MSGALRMNAEREPKRDRERVRFERVLLPPDAGGRSWLACKLTHPSGAFAESFRRLDDPADAEAVGRAELSALKEMLRGRLLRDAAGGAGGADAA